MSPEQLVYSAAVAVVGLFTGGSLFIGVVDVPARAALEPAIGREHFRQMYPRATVLQAPLAAGGSILGWTLYLLAASTGGLIVGLSLATVVVYTLGAIMPVNRRLMDSRVELSDGEVSELLATWAGRHRIRTLLGATAYAGLLVLG